MIDLRRQISAARAIIRLLSSDMGWTLADWEQWTGRIREGKLARSGLQFPVGSQAPNPRR